MTMGNSLLAAAVLWGASGGEPMTVSARLDAADLAANEAYTITVDFDMAEGADVDAGGMPHPILQVKVPPSAELQGEVLTEHRELARNKFLQAPFERVLESSPAKVAFKLKRAPGKDEAFFLNVVAYPRLDDGSAVFVRKRFRLPLSPNAKAEEVDSSDSSWGADTHLQIGDKAPNFTLPSGDGRQVDLHASMGDGPIIVTTYRAHW